VGKKVGLIKFGVLVGGVITTVFGGGWESFLATTSPTQQLEDDGAIHYGSIHNTIIAYRIVGNNNHQLEKNERIYLVIIRPNWKIIATPLTGYTKSQLIQWAKENARDLLFALFDSDPVQNFTSPVSTVENPIKILTVGPEESGKSSSKRSSLSSSQMNTNYNSFIVLGSENSFLVNRGREGKSSAWSFFKNFGNNFGIGIGYRRTKMADKFHSTSYFLNLSPYFQLNINLNERLKITNRAYLTGNILYIKSKMFPEGTGYFQYGFGYLLKPTYIIQPDSNMYWNGGVGFLLTKKYMPKSWIPQEMEFMAEAINNLPVDKIVTLSTALGKNFTSNIHGEMGTIYVRHLQIAGVGEGRSKALYYYSKLNATFGKWKVGIGYKYVTRLADYRERAYMVSIRYDF